MSSNNVVVIVSNNARSVDFITSKLVLLRDVDRVEHTNTIEAVDCLVQEVPNLIILTAESDDLKRLKLVQEIKQEDILKNIPILLIADKCTPEFLVEAYDNKVADILNAPIQEHELLFRVMWNIQKNEERLCIERKNKFLANLGIIQLNTGFYTKKYCEEFLTNEIESAIEQKKQACVMLISVQNNDDKEDILEFANTIKKSIRLNDVVGIADKNKYYLFLPKTKLNGAYSVFERLKQNASMNYKITASVTEVLNKSFDKIKEYLQNSIDEVKSENSSLNVVSDVAKIGEVNVFKNNASKIDESMISKALNTVLEKNNISTQTPVPDSNIPDFSFQKAIKKTRMSAKDREDIEIEKRNAVVYKQAFQRKMRLVVEPVFEKYKNLLQDNDRYIFTEYKTSLEKSYFKAVKGANELLLYLNYEGLSKVQFEVLHIFNTRMKNSETIEVEIIELNKESLMDIFDQFIEILNNC